MQACFSPLSDNEFQLSEALGAALGVTRGAAVWKKPQKN